MIRIFTYEEMNPEELFMRGTDDRAEDVSAGVSEIIDTVRREGDAALKRYTAMFDRVEADTLEVSEEEKKEGIAKADPKLYAALERAAANIRRFHAMQLDEGFYIEEEGMMIGQKVTPVDSAGLYVPGGTAAYSSTVLMDAIPASIAGVAEICMVTPPGEDGRVAPAILAAAEIAGVTRIFKVGGAQAIAALAYGTESVPKVDVIVGPGNAYVAEAKKQIFGLAGIDMIAGPSEILVVADADNDASAVAADMLAQAEHDVMATSVLITDSAELAEAVRDEIEKQLEGLERESIARASIDNNGKIIVTDDLATSIRLANEIAPEHLELCVKDPFSYLDEIRHAGSVFLGHYTPEALGDYYAGPNHTLPTGGTAKFSSPLSVDAFRKKTQYIYYDRERLRGAAEDIYTLACAEGLTAHGRSVMNRFDNTEQREAGDK